MIDAKRCCLGIPAKPREAEVTCEAEGVGTTANLGLKAKLSLLVAYDPLWPAAFEDEKVRLAKALGPVSRGIEHYGSTAVPGLCAKPILDIMVGILPLSDWERCKPALEALGYDYAEGAGVPEHYIFGRGRDRTERTHLVHVVAYEGESWRASLAFRDALRRDASLRDSYAREKERAAAAAPGNRAAYNQQKGPFIAKSIKKLSGQQTA
jgi:GrpB-like predicted nucleotidyltransferase (UPF0157 family)